MIELPAGVVPNSAEPALVDRGGVMRGASALRVNRKGSHYRIACTLPPLLPDVGRVAVRRLATAKRLGLRLPFPLMHDQSVPAIPLTAFGPVMLEGGRATKTGGDTAWNAAVFSQASLANGARAQFRFTDPNLNAMVGLNANPLPDLSFQDLDAAWWGRGGGVGNNNSEVVINGAGTGIMGGAWDSRTTFEVAYTGSRFNWIKDGITFHSVTANPGLSLFLDSSFQEVGSGAWDLSFAGYGAGGFGSPMVNGNGQSGRSLALKGITGGAVLREGYWLSIVDASGQHYLHLVTDDFTVAANGTATITIEPELRYPFADSAVVHIGDPMIEGLVDGSEQAWSYSLAHHTMLDFVIEEAR